MNPVNIEDIHAGQFLCGGFQGTSVTSQAYHLIVEHKVSTLILSRKNTSSVAQMTKLIRDLQYIAYKEGNYEYPIMFAMDSEGGLMNSLFDEENLAQFPSAMALAATGDTDLAYEVSKAVAIELKQIGILIVLGPVLDVVTKLSHQLLGVRSFGTTLDDVTKFGAACARGFRAGGLYCVGKHFPGIGNATVDSLLELPMIADSLDQVKHFNSVPFARLIQDNLLDGVSAAGCGVPTISPDETHACLSPILITQLLRQELKFEGFVLSECLEMDALYHSIGLEQGVILAISAGCDLVMVCHNFSIQNEAIASINKGLSNGNLDEETVVNSFNRIRKLQKGLPTWDQLFPRGKDSAIEDEIVPLKIESPELWQKHLKLSSLAYQKSITLVRDFNSTLPISKFFTKKADEVENLLLLTPLLNPIYPSEHVNQKKGQQLYNGEEVFQKFGDMLSNHPINKDRLYNVLHTTYTANGLTPLHESLIENSKIIIIMTSEASRNMYQIGIVKYVSILCGANPSSFGQKNASYSQLSKPLIIIATLSPYDFFYNKSIGSAYLCCYDYTNNALTNLVGVLMGDFEAEGCIPGEKKFIGKNRKRKTIEPTRNDESPKQSKGTTPKRRWLVDDFDLNRDLSGLVNLWKNNTVDADTYILDKNSVDYLNDEFYKKLYGLLATSKNQKHFVVRNSSLNILYGIVLTWVTEHSPLDGDLTVESFNTGSIVYILVDKSRRLQSIGKNLHARALRYLVQEKNCTQVSLGSSFPLLCFPESNAFTIPATKTSSFIQSIDWNIRTETLKKKYVMVLDNLDEWQVPKKIFRELMIVGVRFDICNDPEKLMKLIDRAIKDEDSPEDADEKFGLKSLYLESIKHIQNPSSYGVKIIIALEPTNQSVIGSIVLFTNKSQLSKFYPFIDECLNDESQTPLIGGIIGPVIDPLYSNLTEIFKYGLICSAITYLKSSLNDSDVQVNQCMMLGINDDKSISGVKEIGFVEWKYYYDHYDKKTNPGKVY